MKNIVSASLPRLFAALGALLFSAGLHSAVTDIASAPVITSSNNATPVPPNLMFVLDDSGSMDWDFLPDWTNDSYCKRSSGAVDTGSSSSRCCRNRSSGTDSCMYGQYFANTNTNDPVRRMDLPMTNSDFNFAYYNPAIRYQPPKNADGTSRTSMTCTNTGGTVSGTNCTSGWAAVKLDAFGVQEPASRTVNLVSGFPDVEWCTDNNFTNCRKNSNYFYPSNYYNTFHGVVGNPFYYNIIPGEYCTTDKLTNCVAASAPSNSYPVPAKLRWCSDTALTTCQGIKNATYRYPRYPTLLPSDSSTGNLTVVLVVTGSSTAANNKAFTINSIPGGTSGPAIVPTMSSPPSSNNVDTVADNIVSRIGNGYVSSAKTCSTSGTTRTCTVTVMAPASGTCPSGAITPSVTSSGAQTTTIALTLAGGTDTTMNRFSGSCRTPGAFERVDIVPSNNSYPKSTARTDCAGATCTYLEEMANFANWLTYYRTRMQMMKTSTSLAFSTISDNFRVGYMSINNSASPDGTNTGTSFLNITTFDSTQKASWYGKLFAAYPSGSTPLRSALSTAGLIYGGVLNGTTFNGSTVTDPVLYSCQNNYTLLSTDGYWNEGSNHNDSGCDRSRDGAGCKLDGSSPIGNADAGTARPYSDGGVSTVTAVTPIVTVTTVTTPVDSAQTQTRTETVVTPQTRSAPVTYGNDGRIVSSTACTGGQAGKRRIAVVTVTPATGTATQSRSVTTTIPQSRIATSPSSQVVTTTSTVTHTVITTNGTVTSDSTSNPVVNSNTVTTATGTPTYSTPTSGTPTSNNPSWGAATLSTPTYSAGALSGSNNNAGCSSSPAGTVITPPTATAGTYGAAASGTPTSDTFSNWTNSGAATNTATGAAQTSVVGPTAGQTTTTTDSTGGASDTLADVAYYYYTTDLRAAGSINPTTNRDVGTGESYDSVSGTYKDAVQRMSSYTLGLGIDGYMKFRSDYGSASSGDYYDIANSATSSASTCTWQASGETCNWPTPSSDSQANIDDLWHAAVNGRGEYFSARSPAELAAGIASALNSINAKDGAAAAATTSNPNITTGDNFLFSSDYRTKDWYSRLMRLQIDESTGNIKTRIDASTGLSVPIVDWEAGALLDTFISSSGQGGRKILTLGAAAGTCASTYPSGGVGSNLRSFCWESLTATEQGYFSGAGIASLPQFCATGTYVVPGDPTVRTCLDSTQQASASGAALIDFLRGDSSREDQTGNTNRFYRDRIHTLGDIVSSEAVYVKTPLVDYSDAAFQEFKVDQTAHTGMVYVAANDGMLHAFNATTGAEVWAYVPTMAMPKMFNLASMNYGNDHKFIVDGTPVVGYAYLGSSSVLKDNWRTVLVGGLGAGGTGFYALDITDPANPVGMWEFKKATSGCAATVDDAVGRTSDCDLGFSMGNPVVTRLMNGTWVVLVTSGYNNTTPGDGKGYLYVLNAATGAIIKKIGTGVGSNSAITNVCSTAPCPSGLSRIGAWVDNPQNDPTVKRVYGGDLFGNLWRFDVNNNIGAPGYDAQLLAVFKGPTGTLQSVTTRPELGESNGVSMVMVGTGRLLGDSDRSAADQTGSNKQSFYGVKDPLTATGWGDIRAAGISQQTVTVDATTRARTIVAAAGFDLATQPGWSIDLPDEGELSNTDPSLALGTLVFTTNLPIGSACSSGGESFIYNLDYRSGAQIGGGPAGWKLANSLATRPVVVQLPSGAVRSITRLSDTTTDVRDVKIGSGSTNPRRVSWRQLVNE